MTRQCKSKEGKASYRKVCKRRHGKGRQCRKGSGWKGIGDQGKRRQAREGKPQEGKVREGKRRKRKKRAGIAKAMQSKRRHGLGRKGRREQRNVSTNRRQQRIKVEKRQDGQGNARKGMQGKEKRTLCHGRNKTWDYKAAMITFFKSNSFNKVCNFCANMIFPAIFTFPCMNNF